MRMGFNGIGGWVLGGLLTLAALHDAQAEQPSEADKPVAVVLGREIPRAALASDDKTRQSERAARKPEDFARWESMNEVQRLMGLVLGPLLKDYARYKGLEPTKQEVQDYISAFSRHKEELIAREKEDNERRRQELRRVDLPPAKRQSLQTELESSEQLVKAFSEETDEDPSLAAEESEMLARSMVLSWKLQRALHREYGGDIIFQQAGPEAVGAYLPFLEARMKAGDFKILDEALGRRFWDSVRRAPGIRMESNTLETPWWLMRPDRKR
ncbi:hypothetical protein [Myxococcus qinghaiensis]|uniref:hypothetical protein n=1 Tax=Myxococcus qinghaiensis TaxID=2906758 RepID=UPI0020A80AAF|nr:hypothetical protein [Myxococcus qinghaiensis]MCP3162116.1 hypothetical protein [Myxococcus qinghaiensis]